ncbi:hypothetical protein R1flu_006372 [Riccia fluitans]|uniref:Uncharacterized protein n=1 Tax=Riccia fluitans TaxID=41844 RepID=A0ABD1YVT6_9MARC
MHASATSFHRPDVSPVLRLSRLANGVHFRPFLWPPRRDDSGRCVGCADVEEQADSPYMANVEIPLVPRIWTSVRGQLTDVVEQRPPFLLNAGSIVLSLLL